jgi:hypothetical protein
MSPGSNGPSTRQQVIAALSQIIGLPLTAAHRAADMRSLQFGNARLIGDGTVGDFALHLQCPWRIEGPDGIITGRLDLWEPVDAGPGFDWDAWDSKKSPNLQDVEFDRWLARHGSTIVVSNVDADDYGGASITFSPGFVLRLFPAGTRGEDWRLFRPKSGAPHFVVSGGKVEPACEPRPFNQGQDS